MQQRRSYGLITCSLARSRVAWRKLPPQVQAPRLKRVVRMTQMSSAVEHIEVAKVNRSGRPIDRNHLAKQCLGDEWLEHEVLRLFDTSVRTYFGRLELSVTYDELCSNLHLIKSAAIGVGAWDVADLAEVAETEIKSGQPVNPERIADIGIVVEEVRCFIAAMLDNEPSDS